MNYILFDDTNTRKNLLPLTFLRPVADIRLGIMTLREKWEEALQTKTSTLTEVYLHKKWPLVIQDDNILIDGSVCPNPEILENIKTLKPNQALVYSNKMIAFFLHRQEFLQDESLGESVTEEIHLQSEPLMINNTWDIFALNGKAIQYDFDRLTHGKKSAKLSDSNRIIGNGNIFVEEGVVAECATFNTSNGPIYLGKNVEIMEGSMIRGPFAACESSTVKMGAKIYGPVTLGPHAKVGGELNTVVIFGYSNKAHDGFLGHSVIGEWCNIGADTNNSNLKNTYEEVKLWNYSDESFVPTGLQFCGLIMGDHSKSAINTMFNTGTVVGVNANVFGAGFPRNFIPSFSWGGAAGMKTYDLKKAIQVASAMYARRGLTFDSVEQDILSSVFEQTFGYRSMA